eukprot:6810227-Prymnesium_polylepis.1
MCSGDCVLPRPVTADKRRLHFRLQYTYVASHLSTQICSYRSILLRSHLASPGAAAGRPPTPIRSIPFGIRGVRCASRASSAPPAEHPRPRRELQLTC